MKVYCEKCIFYYYTDITKTHFCERPEWTNVSSYYTEEDAIHWPRLEYQHHDNYFHAEKVNENNDCTLYTEKNIWHTIKRKVPFVYIAWGVLALLFVSWIVFIVAFNH